MAVVCNLMMIGRWSELKAVCVCHHLVEVNSELHYQVLCLRCPNSGSMANDP